LQRDPDEGREPSQRTEARIAYDEGALYVAVRAFDSDPDKIVGILTRRDQRSPSDWIRIVVDSYFDKRSAYEFGVNPVGVKTDRYYFNDGQSDDSWDAVWDVEVEKDADGWRAEFRIPFSQLRFNNTTGGPVGFAVIREVGRLAETSTWPLLSAMPTDRVAVQRAGGLKMSGAEARADALRLARSTRARLTKRSATNSPIGRFGRPRPECAVTPGLTLTATANHDFGQVEADPAVVNLDAFETFFPRTPAVLRRLRHVPLQHGLQRRQLHGPFLFAPVGRAPRGRGRRQDEYSKQPDAATIIGAAKLTGRLGFSIGLTASARGR
jgi:hypothetical protein